MINVSETFNVYYVIVYLLLKRSKEKMLCFKWAGKFQMKNKDLKFSWQDRLIIIQVLRGLLSNFERFSMLELDVVKTFQPLLSSNFLNIFTLFHSQTGFLNKTENCIITS